ncbi:MAG TPA: PAS domain S-box protein, partial [Puia sp.]
MKPKGTITGKNNIAFSSISGEMASLTREKDWSRTSLGPIKDWPQSLLILVNIVLNSRFPMLLMWGPDLLTFYNDGFRPSLGQNGKHPHMLGMRADEAWTEIWDTLKPLFDQVLSGGEAIWSQDQLVPIYRNGKIEDVYWTYSYSPVNDESGKINGLLVTCVETTETVSNKKKSEESERRLRSMILQAPVSIGIFHGPDHITEIANDRALELWGRKITDVLQRPIMEVMPELKSQGIKELLDEVYNTGKIFVASERPFQILRNGKMETVYLNFSYEPLYNSAGEIDGVMAVGSDVTEQVLGHKKVEASEEKLNVVIEASELGTFELDLKTDEGNYSEMFYEIFGYSGDEKIDHRLLLDHLFEDDVQIRNSAFKEAMQTGSLSYQSRVLLRDKSLKWIEVKGKIFYDNENQPRTLIGTCRDITNEKKYRTSIEESERKFRLLADSMPQHIWTASQQGNLNYFNQSVYDYSGLSPEQLNKEGWMQIVHPDDKERNIQAWTEAVATGKDFLFEHRFRRHDGQYRWQLSRAKPQRDEQGNIQMWVGSSTDIQDQKNFREELENQVRERTAELLQLNEALKKSEERYHLMVEEVQDYAILYLNREGIVENWNTGAEKIKGYKAEEIIGRSFSNFYTEEDRQSRLPQKLLNLASETGRAIQEGWRVRKDGSLFWASVLITAVHNEKRDVIGYSKVTHDLTAKKEAENILKKQKLELEEKNEELEKANKELQSFAYISSHDLQEPLRKIQTFASRIIDTEKNNLSGSGKDLFTRMQRSAARMQKLIDDLLTYSRTHSLRKDFEKINLRTIVEDVEQNLKEEIGQAQARVEIPESCD